MITVECKLCPGRHPIDEPCQDCGYDPNCVCCMLAVSKKDTTAFFAEPVYNSYAW